MWSCCWARCSSVGEAAAAGGCATGAASVAATASTESLATSRTERTSGDRLIGAVVTRWAPRRHLRAATRRSLGVALLRLHVLLRQGLGGLPRREDLLDER